VIVPSVPEALKVTRPFAMLDAAFQARGGKPLRVDCGSTFGKCRSARRQAASPTMCLTQVAKTVTSASIAVVPWAAQRARAW
jgi:hypothetical protein